MVLKAEPPHSAPDAGGLLVIVPSEADGQEEIPPSTPLAGLPLLRRIVLAAGRAGFGQVLVGHPRFEDRRLLSGTAAVLTSNGPMPPLLPGRVVFLPANVLPQSQWLRQLLEMPIEGDQLYIDGASVAVVDVKDPERVVAMAVRCRSAAEVVAVLRGMFKTVDRPLDEGGKFPLATPRDVPAAETWLLRGLIKPSEGFMSRHVERRISLALTRRLCATRITPNAMTLVSVAIGLLGAPLFLSLTPAYQLVGALLFLVHSVLDGCDGELARLKFLESRTGAILDICGDNLVHVAVFACMAVGWSLHIRATWPLLLGGVTVVSTVWLAAIVYGRGMRASIENGTTSPLSRLADALIYRDFIYLVLLLAALGKVRWFLVLTAVGAPIFLLLLLWIGRARGTT